MGAAVSLWRLVVLRNFSNYLNWVGFLPKCCKIFFSQWQVPDFCITFVDIRVQFNGENPTHCWLLFGAGTRQRVLFRGFGRFVSPNPPDWRCGFEETVSYRESKTDGLAVECWNSNSVHSWPAKIHNLSFSHPAKLKFFLALSISTAKLWFSYLAKTFNLMDREYSEIATFWHWQYTLLI